MFHNRVARLNGAMTWTRNSHGLVTVLPVDGSWTIGVWTADNSQFIGEICHGGDHRFSVGKHKDEVIESAAKCGFEEGLGLSGGAIAGITIAVFIVVAAAAVLVFFLWKKFKGGGGLDSVEEKLDSGYTDGQL
jgi:hypothetical protein